MSSINPLRKSIGKIHIPKLFLTLIRFSLFTLLCFEKNVDPVHESKNFSQLTKGTEGYQGIS